MTFNANNLEKAVDGEILLLGPYEPFLGFKVAIVEDDGAPLELIEMGLSDEAVFGAPKAKSVTYPEAVVLVTAQDVINC